MPESRPALLRRRRLRAAIVTDDPGAAIGRPGTVRNPPNGPAPERTAEHPLSGVPPITVVYGIIADASPHLLVLVTTEGAEMRLPMSTATTVWWSGRSGLDALRRGRDAVVRLDPRRLVDRVWVDITRVTGVIVERGHHTAEVDGGPHRGRSALVFTSLAWEKVQLRHPRFEPGQLADVIGVRTADGTRVTACTPATAQPESAGAHAAHRPLTDPLPARFHGTVTWFDATAARGRPYRRGGFGRSAAGPGAEDPTKDPCARPDAGSGLGNGRRPAMDTARDATGEYVRGVAYPALDPVGDGAACRQAGPGCSGLPYLSLGSDLRVRNDCDGRSATLPITACGCVAARFCDRCAECGPSARGRVAELTAVSFAELGGELATGCFNATVAVATSSPMIAIGSPPTAASPPVAAAVIKPPVAAATARGSHR